MIRRLGDKMTEDIIKKINELANKAKTEGLTPEETIRQQELRQEYLALFRQNLRGTHDNVSIKESDGTIRKLQPKKK